MKITKLQGLSVLSMLVVSTFVSCEEHNPFSEQELFNQEYSKNFFKTYGQFPAGQSWDFSDAPRTAAIDPSIFDLGRVWGSATTRAGGSHEPGPNAVIEHWYEAAVEYQKSATLSAGKLVMPTYDPEKNSDQTPYYADPYYYVEKGTIKWLDENIPEGKNNTFIGSPFTLTYNSSSNFALIPIYQGSGSVKYKLHMVSIKDNVDYVIWDNWPLTTNDVIEGDSRHPDSNSGTNDFQFNNKDAYPADHNSSNWGRIIKIENLQNLEEEKKNIRSIPMLIKNVEGEFYFYLEVTSLYKSYGNVGEHHSSREGMMLTLNCPVPKDINNYKTLFGIGESETISNVMVIGCEDSKKSDWDINDIVFLYVGLMDLPQKIEVKHSKRYLIEDMGTTVDFDFNDVVVDVTETVMTNPDGTEGEVLSQEAIIRHKCGTLPFQVYFADKDGDVMFKGKNEGKFDRMNGKVQGTNEQYEYVDEDNVKVRLAYSKYAEEKIDNTKYKVMGGKFWDSATNNIRVAVFDNDKLDAAETWVDNDNLKIVSFTKPNEKNNAPYIIAVPTTVNWTAESLNFPIDKVTEYNTSATSTDNDN